MREFPENPIGTSVSSFAETLLHAYQQSAQSLTGLANEHAVNAL